MAAALLLIDYQFFEDEGDCYCNPFLRMRVQVLRLQHVRMPPRVGHLFRPARRRRAVLLRLLLVPMLSLGYYG